MVVIFRHLTSDFWLPVVLLAQLVEHLTFNQRVRGSNPLQDTILHADVAELADALDLGSSTVRCAGSTPVIRTKIKES